MVRMMGERGRKAMPTNPEAEEAPGGFSSPACALHEADAAFRGYLDRAEVLSLLNELLEGEARLLRRLDEGLARIEDDGLHAELMRLRDAHRENVERCRRLLENAKDAGERGP